MQGLGLRVRVLGLRLRAGFRAYGPVSSLAVWNFSLGCKVLALGFKV